MDGGRAKQLYGRQCPLKEGISMGSGEGGMGCLCGDGL